MARAIALSRSWLFLPATRADFIARAHERGADLLVLDLEDAVPPARKAEARASVAASVAALRARGMTVGVRINPWDAGGGAADCDALRSAPPDVLVVPKTNGTHDLAGLATDPLAASLPWAAMIEQPAGLFAATEIAAYPRVAALCFGPEDFAAAAGVAPEPDTLALPAQMLALAAATRRIPAIGVVGSLVEYRNPERYRAAALAARRLGFQGALCIHPSQVAIANAVFLPNEEERAWAERVIAAAGEGGATAGPCGMIDAPIVARARRILAERQE